jgi:hypothetical protein
MEMELRNMRRWEAGSEPPTGFYWFRPVQPDFAKWAVGELIRYKNDDGEECEVMFYVDGRGHKYAHINTPLYGPIPEPEETEA